jgi:hypothetical protein
LTIDGQGSTLNFASPVVACVTIGSSERIIFKNFNIDWPNELMASLGTIASVDNPRHTMTVKIDSPRECSVHSQASRTKLQRSQTSVIQNTSIWSPR